MSIPDPNPAADSNNRHHAGGYRSERDWLDDVLGRGDGDPDLAGYPDELTMKGNYETSTTDVPF